MSHPDTDPSALAPGLSDTAVDEEIFEDDVNYGIADCRKRLRSRRSTLRAQHHPPKECLNGEVRPAAGRVGSYAEEAVKREGSRGRSFDGRRCDELQRRDV